MKQENKKPLYKVLNEQRRQGNLELNPYGRKDILQVNNGEAERWEMPNFCTCYGEEESERIANTQYTALCVNNLHHLAKALEELHKAAMDVGITEWWQKHTETVAKAKEALNRIS